MTTGPLSQCGTCQRLRSPFSPEATGQDGPWCEAFPTGIPEAVYDNTLDHREPVDGDHGLQWLARPGATYPDTTIPEGPPMTAATEPTAEEHTGVMIALVPAAADATRLQGTLLAEEGALPLDELHLTLVFLGEVDQLDPATIDELRGLVEQTAATLKPVEAEVFGMAILNPDGDEPCVVLLVGHNDALPDLHLDLINQLHASQVDTSMSHRPWLPHITLAYTDDLLLVGDVVDRAGPVTFDRLRLAVGEEVLDFPLGAQVAAAGGWCAPDVGPASGDSATTLSGYWPTVEGP